MNIKELDIMGIMQEMLDKGWLDEYSKSHFLIKALNGKLDYFIDNKHLILDRTYLGDERLNADNFIMNFSTKLATFKDTFEEKDVKKFVKDQLSAGKRKYQENKFFEALAEVSVLNFMAVYGPAEVQEAIYEPTVIKNGKNPEARLIYKNGITVDIEVKTAGFKRSESIQDKDLFIPSILMEPHEIDEFKEICKKKGINGQMPRIKKLKDFINSAGEKFTTPKDSKHLNLLFINWTYTDMEKKGYLEPYSLLYNDLNGILKNKEWCKKIGIYDDALEKITAIIIYQDTFNSLIFNDFRYHWQYQTFRLLPNMHMKKELLSMEVLVDTLRMYPPKDEDIMPYLIRTNKIQLKDTFSVMKFINELIKKNLDGRKSNIEYMDEKMYWKREKEHIEHMYKVYEDAKKGYITGMNGIPVSEIFKL